MNMDLVKEVASGISNCTYYNDFRATEQLINLFDCILKHKPQTAAEYIKAYNDNFYTYHTWKELVDSEKEQSDGLTEDECRSEIGKTIWQLPCGWFVQYV